MGKDDNTAGWILTTIVYSLGGRMETGSGTKAKATLNNPQTVTALNMLQQMRWTDNSMGSNFDYGWSDINQAFAAGNVGMYISGSDVFTNLVQASNIDPNIYGVTTIPLARQQERPACSAAARWRRFGPNANAGRAARRRSSGSTSTTSSRWSTSRRRSATRRRWSRPSSRSASRRCRSSTRRSTTSHNVWIKPYINVPQAQMKPFTSGIFKQHLIPEPAASTQSVYHSLDAVVEAVLTTQNANIPQLLDRRQQHRSGPDLARQVSASTSLGGWEPGHRPPSRLREPAGRTAQARRAMTRNA